MPDDVRSLTRITCPSLTRAMSLASLLARSLCAADAVDCCESTPAYRNAVSGCLETLASPLVNTPGPTEVVVDAAAGDVMKTGCARPAATTATATTRATSEAPATDTRATRID